MKTLILSSGEIEKAALLIKKGKLVAFPTETVYGLGANVFDSKAVANIFIAKKRPTSDPLIVHCSDLMMVESIAQMTPEAYLLAKEFWPGPLTLILKKKSVIPDIATANTDTVGVRIPKHFIARALIEISGVPIAAPSANIFTRTSPTTAKHVLEDLDGRIDAVISGGRSNIGVESTIVDLSKKTPRILRPGGLSYKLIKKIIPVAQNYDQNKIITRAPGQYKYHYSPKANLVIVANKKTLQSHLRNSNEKVGVLVYDEWLENLKMPNVVIYKWGSVKNSSGLARKLFDGLRTLDKKGALTIYCPLPNSQDIGEAIRNRLYKASGV